MKTIVKWILSILVGGIAGFLLMMIVGESLFMFLTSGVVAFLAAGVTYGIFQNSSLKGLLAAGSAIGSFLLYLRLLDHLNENAETMFFPMLIFLLPYVLLVFLLASASEKNTDSQELNS